MSIALNIGIFLLGAVLGTGLCWRTRAARKLSQAHSEMIRVLKEALLSWGELGIPCYCQGGGICRGCRLRNAICECIHLINASRREVGLQACPVDHIEDAVAEQARSHRDI